MDSLDELKQSLLFLHVGELRQIADELALSNKGKKIVLITRICHFLATGEKLTTPPYPKLSCAKRGESYPISKERIKTTWQPGSFSRRSLGSTFISQLLELIG